jgi:electron transfer flavoprotein alpha/beta subunit
MDIIVCIKQVPDTTTVRINPETNTLIREGVECIVNPFDMYAIEEGLRLRERCGGKVTVITMGPPQAQAALREALSLGADEAILVSNLAFAGSDTWATSLTLAKAIEKIGQYDLILCGKQAIDGDTAQVGPVWGPDEIGVDPQEVGLKGSPTYVARIFSPERKGTAKVFRGDPEQAVEQLLEELRSKKLL